MNINITSRKFRAKDSLKDYINETVKSLQKYNDDIMEADVVLYYTHPKDSIKHTEINLKIPGDFLTVSTESDDFMKSTNDAVEKLARQLKKIKSKQMSMKVR